MGGACFGVASFQVGVLGMRNELGAGNHSSRHCQGALAPDGGVIAGSAHCCDALAHMLHQTNHFLNGCDTLTTTCTCELSG